MRRRSIEIQGPAREVACYFGYDEPNFTYSANGRKLVEELARLSPGPVYLRTHNLFTSGDGTASLKWGSTNVCRIARVEVSRARYLGAAISAVPAGLVIVSD
jgi:hypothetical protein